jgi:hypothetical protein
VSGAADHVKKAKKALDAMAKGGKKNAAAASQVSGNLTAAMNQLAAANSYVLSLLFCLSLTRDRIWACLRTQN